MPAHKSIPQKRNLALSCPLPQLLLTMVALVFMALNNVPAHAQDLEKFDPDQAFEQSGENAAGPTQADSTAIDADLVRVPADPAQDRERLRSGKTTDALPQNAPAGERGFDDEFTAYSEPPAETQGKQWVDPASGASIGNGETGGAAAGPAAGDVAQDSTATQQVSADSATYAQDDLIGAAEGVFGKGAEGLARIIEDLLEKEGQPNGYIVGREAGGAFIFGARYGSGTLHHKIEGKRKVYWTGPSVGFDAGANAANTFVLVYNLFDSEDLFKRYPAGEGQAYLIGGLHASYMRRGDVVLIPIRMGAGVRLGVNAGYMKFSKKQRWLPF